MINKISIKYLKKKIKKVETSITSSKATITAIASLKCPINSQAIAKVYQDSGLLGFNCKSAFFVLC